MPLCRLYCLSVLFVLSAVLFVDHSDSSNLMLAIKVSTNLKELDLLFREFKLKIKWKKIHGLNQRQVPIFITFTLRVLWYCGLF